MSTCSSTRSLAVLLTLLGGVGAGCTDTAVPPDTSPVRIAASRPVSGPLAPEGMNVERGYLLAVRMLNEAGGIGGRLVELVLSDDGSDPQTAAELYRDFVAEESVDLLLGPYASSITQAVVEVTEAAARPLIAPLAASHEIWGDQNRQWTVQMMNNARANLSGAVAVAATEGVETVALVYEDSRFPVSAAEGVRDVVAEHGLDLVLDESYPVGGADHAALTARAEELGADLFLGGGYTADAVAFANAVAAASYYPLLTSWAIGPAEPDWVERVGVDRARCVIGNAPWAASLTTTGPLATNAGFIQAYQEEYGLTPGYTAAAAFATVELLYKAAEAAILESGEIPDSAVRDYLFSNDAETVLGPYGVAPLGDPDAGSQTRLFRKQLQWQDDGEGGLVQRLIHPESVAEAEPCTNSPPDIVVAFTYSATGPLSTDAARMLRGYRLASQMLNEGGGIDGRSVRLVAADDASSPQRAAELYYDFASGDSVDMVLGPYSSAVTAAVVPIVEAARMPFVASLAADPGIWEKMGREWSVQLLNSAESFLSGAVELAAAEGLTTASLVYLDSEFPRAVAEGVRSAANDHDIELVLDMDFSEDPDYEALAVAAMDAEGEIFIGGGYSSDAIGLTEAAAAVGYAPRLTSWAVGPEERSFYDEVGDLARCVVGYTSWLPGRDTEGAIADNATFVARFEELHGETPGFTAASAFGAMELLVEAMTVSVAEVGGIDDSVVRDHLFSTETQTVFGDYRVVPLGESSAGTQLAAKGLLVQWQDDGQGGLSQRVVHPPSEAEADPCFGS